MSQRSSQLFRDPFCQSHRLARVVLRALARRRDDISVQRLAGWAALVVSAYDNHSHHIADNGERRLLAVLGRFGFRHIIDAGANRGDWACDARRWHANAEIHCFEVVPATAARLRQRLGRMAGVHIVESGLSDHLGTARFKIYPDDSTKASVCDLPLERLRSQWITRPVTTGDAYLAERSIDHVDFVKLDVEGAEPQVLHGFSGALAEGRIDALQFEYGRYSLLTGFWLRDFHALLGGYGYVVGRIYPSAVDFSPYAVLRDEDFRGANFVAVRTDCGHIIDAVRGR